MAEISCCRNCGYIIRGITGNHKRCPRCNGEKIKLHLAADKCDASSEEIQNKILWEAMNNATSKDSYSDSYSQSVVLKKKGSTSPFFFLFLIIAILGIVLIIKTRDIEGTTWVLKMDVTNTLLNTNTHSDFDSLLLFSSLTNGSEVDLSSWFSISFTNGYAIIYAFGETIKCKYTIDSDNLIVDNLSTGKPITIGQFNIIHTKLYISYLGTDCYLQRR